MSIPKPDEMVLLRYRHRPHHSDPWIVETCGSMFIDTWYPNVGDWLRCEFGWFSVPLTNTDMELLEWIGLGDSAQ